MKKEDKALEIEYLFQRTKFILEFMYKKEPHEFIKEMIVVIEDEYNKKKRLTGIRMASRDINAMAKSLCRSDVLELNTLLASKFGDTLEGDKSMVSMLKKVQKRGKIITAEEYRMIHDYISDLTERDADYPRISEFDALLNTYDGPLEDA